MLSSGAVRDLQGQVDEPHVYTRPADLAAYAWDAFGASGDRNLPDAVVFPATTEEVSGVLQVCAHHGLAIIPRGAGTGYSGGAAAVGGGVVLNLCRMSRILGMEVEAMRLHAEAGAITAAVHRRAATAGLQYPPDPGSATISTLGGNIACNASGPHGLRYGDTRDHLVGATALLADGSVLRLGELGDGDAALLRLLPGSEGTLAVVTEVLVRLIPAPEARATLAAIFPTMEAAVGAAAGIARAGIVPAALEVMDGEAIEAVARGGLRRFPEGTGAAVIVEVEGPQNTVNTEGGEVRTALERAGATRLEHAANAAAARELWKVRKAISGAVAELMVGKINEDVVVPRDRVAELIATSRTIGARHQVPVVNFGHLGDGNIHTTFLIDPRVGGERERGEAAASDLLDAVLEMGGSLSGEHGVGCTRLGHVERQLGGEGIALQRRVKAVYDPHGLLNPGKKLPPMGAEAAAELLSA